MKILSFILTLSVAVALLVPYVNLKMRERSNIRLSELKARVIESGDEKALKEIVKMVDGPNGPNAVAAFGMLPANLPKESVERYIIPELAEALRSTNPSVRREAALAARLFGHFALDLAPALTHMATNDSPAQAALAIEAMESMSGVESWLLLLADYFQNSTYLPGGGANDDTPKARVARALCKNGSVNVESISIFKTSITDINSYVRFWSAIGLYRGGKQKDMALATLFQLLASTDEGLVFDIAIEVSDMDDLPSEVRGEAAAYVEKFQ